MAEAGDIKQFIFPLVFYKRISDVWDEEYNEAIDLYDNDDESARLEKITDLIYQMDATGQMLDQHLPDIGHKIHTSLREIEQANFELLHDVFGDAQLD